MTNKEANKFLSQIMDVLLANNSWLPSTDNPIKESFGMAINALTAQTDHIAEVRKMGDLISKQAAISLPPKPREDRYFQTQSLDDAYEYGWRDLQGCIEKMPPAQPEIIRCKDCKYYMPYEWMWDDIPRSSDINDYSPDEIGCARIDIHFKPNGFCCLAERREDGNG